MVITNINKLLIKCCCVASLTLLSHSADFCVAFGIILSLPLVATVAAVELKSKVKHDFVNIRSRGLRSFFYSP